MAISDPMVTMAVESTWRIWLVDGMAPPKCACADASLNEDVVIVVWWSVLCRVVVDPMSGGTEEATTGP